LLASVSRLEASALAADLGRRAGERVTLRSTAIDVHKRTKLPKEPNYLFLVEIAIWRGNIKKLGKIG
jgi:hypothetical protein